MKIKVSLKKYLIKRIDTIGGMLEKHSPEFRPENFHKLRVEIKKLRALINLINFISTEFKRKKTFKPFKQIFDEAGKVREIQLEEATLKSYILPHSIHDYMSKLREMRLRERKVFFSMMNARLNKQFNIKYHLILASLEDAKKESVRKYLHQERLKIRAILKRKNLKPEQIHELRKRIKAYYYLRKFADRKHPDQVDQKHDEFQELMGTWHDKMVTYRHLKKETDKRMLKTQETDILEEIKTNLLSEANERLAKIKGSVKQIQESW